MNKLLKIGLGIFIIIIIVIAVFVILYILKEDEIFYGNTHTHSMPSYEEVIEQAIKDGLSFIVITDYHEVRKVTKEKCRKEKEILCIIGEEVSPIGTRHIIGAGITKTIPSGLTPKLTVELIHKQGGIAILAHPYNAIAIKNGKEIGVDAVECFNPRNHVFFIDEIVKVAEEFNLPCVAVSDAHALDELKLSFSACEMKSLTKKNVLKSIKNGKCSPLLNVPVNYPILKYGGEFVKGGGEFQ